MNTLKFFLLSAPIAFAVLAGCASEETTTDDANLAAQSCAPAQYSAALAEYKNAVAWSKERLEMGICESDNGYLMTIADAASRAVTTCGAFRETIKTSPWAAPLREALGESLTLRSLTGELLVIKDSSFQNWNGTEALLARGVSFWANAQGAYGWPYKINLRADGAATYGWLHYDEATGDIAWKEVPATYRVIATDGPTGKRTVEVTHDGQTESFLLRVEETFMTEHAPVFTLSPAASTQPTQEKLYSIPSECDA